MAKLNIYVAGNMTPTFDHYQSYADKLLHNLKDSNYKCSIANPKIQETAKFIVHHDLARLKKCDLVVANLGVKDTSHHLTGMVVEIYEAYKQNKPVYTFVDDGLKYSEQSKSPWIQEFVTRHFESYEDLVDFLLFDENLPC